MTIGAVAATLIIQCIVWQRHLIALSPPSIVHISNFGRIHSEVIPRIHIREKVAAVLPRFKIIIGAVAAILVIHCLGCYLKHCTASQSPMYFLSKQPNDFRQFYNETNPRDLFQYKDSVLLVQSTSCWRSARWSATQMFKILHPTNHLYCHWILGAAKINMKLPCKTCI